MRVEENCLSRLIPKNHFISMGMFREQPLVDWTFTDTVLFTAYDVYRSRDFWVDSVINQGKTLKEGFVDCGFPKDVTLVADTGIFEIEAKKAGIARNLGIEVDFDLSNEEILWAYEVSGADYFVSPDEIILPTDSGEAVISKVQTIKNNLLEVLEQTPSERIIGVIQGNDTDTMTDLFDFYRDHDIRIFAAGGLIPRWRYDKVLFEEVIKSVRELTKGYWLHTFGLPLIGLLPLYLGKYGMDSVDTSMLLYMTARRQYLQNAKTMQVRLANFEACSCSGCARLSEGLSSWSMEFFVHLYIHNIIEAEKVSCRPIHIPDPSEEPTPIENQRQTTEPIVEVSSTTKSSDSPQNDWKTADQLLNGTSDC
ncbi:MAG: hypothetical protein RTU30_05210 [Candidatus Thorarchaeota archaeon]